MQAIFTDETAVEHVQRRGPHRPKKPKMKLLSEVFGRGELLILFEMILYTIFPGIGFSQALLP